MSPAPRDLHRTDAEWQRWGESDPYFGVITAERFRRRNLTPEVLAEFFETGRSHTSHVLRVCQRQLQPKFAPQRVLDFGCGVGRVLLAMAERIPEAVGVDVSQAMLDEARRNCEERGAGNVTLALSDDALSAVEGSFDLIHSVLVFQHIEPTRGHALVARLLQRLRPGGIAALHFTYAKAQYAERYGQPPPPPPPVPRSRWRSARPEPEPEPVAGNGDPEMQMYPYPLNEIMFSAQRCGVKRSFLEFTDHGGELGAFLYFQRMPR